MIIVNRSIVMYYEPKLAILQQLLLKKMPMEMKRRRE